MPSPFMDEAPQDNPVEVAHADETASDVDVEYSESASWHSLTGSVKRHSFENGR